MNNQFLIKKGEPDEPDFQFAEGTKGIWLEIDDLNLHIYKPYNTDDVAVAFFAPTKEIPGVLSYREIDYDATPTTELTVDHRGQRIRLDENR